MRSAVAEKQVRKGQMVKIACDAPAGAAVSVWGRTDDTGPFPYIPFIPPAKDGKPQIIKPMFVRFLGAHDFAFRAQDTMTIIVMHEADTPDDLTGLKVRFINDRLGEVALKIRRAIGDAFRALRRQDAGSRTA